MYVVLSEHDAKQFRNANRCGSILSGYEEDTEKWIHSKSGCVRKASPDVLLINANKYQCGILLVICWKKLNAEKKIETFLFCCAFWSIFLVVRTWLKFCFPNSILKCESFCAVGDALGRVQGPVGRVLAGRLPRSPQSNRGDHPGTNQGICLLQVSTHLPEIQGKKLNAGSSCCVDVCNTGQLAQKVCSAVRGRWFGECGQRVVCVRNCVFCFQQELWGSAHVRAVETLPARSGGVAFVQADCVSCASLSWARRRPACRQTAHVRLQGSWSVSTCNHTSDIPLMCWQWDTPAFTFGQVWEYRWDRFSIGDGCVGTTEKSLSEHLRYLWNLTFKSPVLHQMECLSPENGSKMKLFSINAVKGRIKSQNESNTQRKKLKKKFTALWPLHGVASVATGSISGQCEVACTMRVTSSCRAPPAICLVATE